MNTASQPARPAAGPAPASIRSITDMEIAITMRAESDATARQVARDMCHQGITRQERTAIYDFLRKVADAVRYPDIYG